MGRGRWRWKILCPCLICSLVVLVAVHGSKGPYSKLHHPVPQRILSQLITGSPAMDAHSELLDSSSFPLLEKETIGSSVSPLPQPQPVCVQEPCSDDALSSLVDTEGSVQTPPNKLPKSVILVPLTWLSSPPDPVTAKEKPPSLAPDVPSSIATSKAGVPGADYHGKLLDISNPVMAPVAEVSPPSIEVPVQRPAKLPGPAVSPTSYTPPATNSTSDGISVVAPPNISHLPPSNSSHAKVPAVSPTSLTLSGNRYALPISGPSKELPSHSSPSNYSQPKGLTAPPPDNHVSEKGSPVAAPPELPHNNVDKTVSPVAAPPKELSIHGSPEDDSHQKGPATSPVTAISPAIRENYGVPIASPPVILANHSAAINYSHAKEPAVSPSIHENHGNPVAAPPVVLSNHSAAINYSHAKEPAVSPSIHENHGIPVAAPPVDLSNHSTPLYHPHPNGPIMPVAAPPENLQNHTTHLNYSHPRVTARPPSTHENNGIPIAASPKEMSSHSPPVNDTHSRGSFPVRSPAPHAPKLPSGSAHTPHSSHPQPPKEKVPADSPSPMPEVSSRKYAPRKRIGNPSAAPSPLLPHDIHHPAPPSKIRPKAYAPPPHSQDSQGAPAPTTSEVAPSTHHNGNVNFPVSSPSASIIWKPLAPLMQPIRALPPPPPSLDCTPLDCFEPYTNSRPGSPCTCVMPIKVGLRLSISSFTFFPLVFGFAQEIAFGISIDQSQVRVMGANADADPDKSIVVIYLLPLGYSFENDTVFSIFEKFWHKQVFTSSSLFTNTEVLYVTYPGLPPSPPVAPRSINLNDGTSGGSNALHPFAVDVRKKKGRKNHGVVAILVLSAVIAFILCAGAIWLFLLKYRARSRHPQTPQALMHPPAKASGTGPTIGGSRQTSASLSFTSSIRTYAGSTKTFSIAEMEKATNNFDESRIIGEGGFGRVYEGTLEDGSRVAIKVLKRDDQQGNREFMAEVEMLSRLHHRNLIKLIGICTEEHNCLVYELVPNSSVESHLHGTDKESAPPLNWATRLKIALGAARGLAYLHEDSSPRVIHRDFKSSNILLEDDFTPKVSDFGLARTAIGEGNEYISTRVMGTFGYVAPEYAMTGHLLVKSDVYSYGVVLLELLTGRKPVDMLRPPGQENLVTWARPLLTSKDGLESIVDPSLGRDIPFDSLAKVAAIASMCVQPEVDQRPFMGEVVQALRLVCNEEEEGGVSGSCSLEKTSMMQDSKEPRSSTEGWDLESQKLSTEPDVLSVSARYTRDMSGSFRRHSSSGPLRPGSSSQKFFHRTRGLTSGSASEHGTFDKGWEAGEQWA